MKKLLELDRDVLHQNRREQIVLSVKRFFRNKLAVIGGTVILIIVLAAIFAPFLTPYDPIELDTKNTFAPMSREHPLGTDDFGRDILSRLLYGARLSLRIGLAVATMAMILGTTIGSFAGYYGGLTDDILMRMMDAMFSIPSILLALVLVTVLGRGQINTIVAIGIVDTPLFARIVRSSVISNKEKEYVEAGVALGQSNLKILFLHIVPNGLAPIIVTVAISIAGAIMMEAGLSFIGLGTPPPTPSWGSMLAQSRAYLNTFPMVAIFPGIALTTTVLGFNLLGDGLRDLLDPKLRRFLK